MPVTFYPSVLILRGEIDGDKTRVYPPNTLVREDTLFRDTGTDIKSTVVHTFNLTKVSHLIN